MQIRREIKNEIKKEEFLYAIYNSKNYEIAKLLLEDYFNGFLYIIWKKMMLLNMGINKNYYHFLY